LTNFEKLQSSFVKAVQNVGPMNQSIDI